MQPIKVLVADDHQIVIDGMKSILEEEKEIILVHTANNGQQVMERLAEQPVDVAILDINMHPMDGLETSREILRQYPNTKVLFLTMYGDSQFIINALKAGGHGYVVKEKSKEYLVGAIHSVYRGARYWSPEILAKIAELGDVTRQDEEPISFTERELELLCMMVEHPGYTSDEIGDELNISSRTVDTHIRNMRNKLKFRSRSELITYAITNKLCN